VTPPPEQIAERGGYRFAAALTATATTGDVTDLATRTGPPRPSTDQKGARRQRFTPPDTGPAGEQVGDLRRFPSEPGP